MGGGSPTSPTRSPATIPADELRPARLRRRASQVAHLAAAQGPIVGGNSGRRPGPDQVRGRDQQDRPRAALTEKTISVIVKSLLDAGVVVESGFAKSTGGKRPVLLRLNDKELYAI